MALRGTGTPLVQATGHLKTAVEYLQTALASGIDWLAYPSIAAHLGIDRRNFGRDVSRSSSFSVIRDSITADDDTRLLSERLPLDIVVSPEVSRVDTMSTARAL
jgi:hypothetical protein